MKKYFLFAFIGCLNTGMFGQDLRLGIFADPMITWMNTDVTEITNDGTRMGVNIGLSVEKFFTENYAFSTGIHISNNGGRLSFKDSTSFETDNETLNLAPNSLVKYKLQYISIPLGLKLKSDEIGYSTFFATVGMLPEINIKAVGDIPSVDIENAGISDEIALFNLSYYIGAGMEYSLGGKTSLSTGITYTNGFINVSNADGYRATIKNVSLRAGIIF